MKIRPMFTGIALLAAFVLAPPTQASDLSPAEARAERYRTPLVMDCCALAHCTLSSGCFKLPSRAAFAGQYRRERRELEALSRQHKISADMKIRAQIILLADRGWINTAIAKKVGTSGNTIGKWRRRFAACGIGGLYDEQGPGRPREHGDETIERAIALTLESTPANATHWSTRLLAQATGLSQSTVSHVWRAFRLQSHRQETFI